MPIDGHAAGHQKHYCDEEDEYSEWDQGNRSHARNDPDGHHGQDETNGVSFAGYTNWSSAEDTHPRPDYRVDEDDIGVYMLMDAKPSVIPIDQKEPEYHKCQTCGTLHRSKNALHKHVKYGCDKGHPGFGELPHPGEAFGMKPSDTKSRKQAGEPGDQRSGELEIVKSSVDTQHLPETSFRN